jgi:hypothetical protein
MTARRTDLSDLPDWPALLSVDQAAQKLASDMASGSC